MSIPFFIAGGVMTINPANAAKPEIGRLQFGNSQHIELVNSAPNLLAKHQKLKSTLARATRRKWAKPGLPCAKCLQAVRQGEVHIRMEENVFHERCAMESLIRVRRDLRALGYNVEALHADPS
jgi:hypothetical protein